MTDRQNGWTGASAGLWTDATSWAQGVPQVGDLVQVTGPGITITAGDASNTAIPQANFVADALQLAAGNTLTVTFAALQLQGTGAPSQIDGALNFNTGASLSAQGTVAVTGTISLGGVALQIAHLQPGINLDTLTLSGGGTVALGDSASGGIVQSGPAPDVGVLSNQGVVITGAGVIGNQASGNGASMVTFNNAAGGVLNANGTQVLEDYASGANAGLMESTGTGRLDLQGSIDNTGGTIAGSGATLTIGDPYLPQTVTNGTLAGVIGINGTVGLAGSVANTATLTLAADSTLTVSGAVIDGAAGSSAPGVINSAGGTVVLNGTVAGGLLQTTVPTGAVAGGGFQAGTSGATLDGSRPGNPLTLSTTVQVGASRTLAVAGSIAGGTIALTEGTLVAGSATLDSATLSGALLLSDSTLNVVQGQDSASLLDNTGTISGAGSVGHGMLSFLNDTTGLVNATGTGALTVNTGGIAAQNLGLMEATGTGGLTIQGTVNQTGSTGAGEIDANNATVLLDHATIKGGTLRAIGTGVITTSGVTFDGSSGPLTLATGFAVGSSSVSLKGAIANAGTIALNGSLGTSVYATLTVLGGATLSGGGTVFLQDTYGSMAQVASIAGADPSGDLLDNFNNTIKGYGSIGGGTLGLINEAAGVIDATAATLIVNSPAWINRGLLEATGGTLDLIGAVTNTGGTILAASGKVLLDGAVAGGTVASGQGALVTGSNAMLDGSTAAVTLQGSLAVGTTLALKGAVRNTGTIGINGNSGLSTSATLQVSGAASLSGGGTLTLQDSYGGLAQVAFVNGAHANGDTLDNVDNTIQGYGILGGTAGLINEAAGVVNATAGTLFLNSPATSNQGRLQATGGILDLQGPIADGGGTIAALTGGQVVLDNATVAGGTLLGQGSLTSGSRGATLDGSVAAVAVQGTLTVGTTLTLRGAIANSGTIALLGSLGLATNATLQAAGAVTLSGGGTVLLRDTYGSNGAVAFVQGATGATLDNVDNTIQGYGALGNGTLAFTNEAAGKVIATAGVLALSAGAAVSTNRGLLQATGGELDVNSALINSGTVQSAGGAVGVNGTLTNTGTVLATTGTISFAAGEAANLAAGTLTGGVWHAVSGIVFADALTSDAATLMLDGTGGSITSAAGAIDASLASIAAGGSLVLVNGRNWAGTGTLANAGEIRLGGSSFVEAALVNTGLVDGTGTLSAALANTGTIEATAGTLTLTQAASGALKIDAGATLVLAAGAATGTSVSFAGTGGTLQLAAGAAPFSLTVSGPATRNTIDLAGVVATGSFASGTLTLSANGATVGTMAFSGAWASAAPDGNGGTLVTTRAPTPAAMDFNGDGKSDLLLQHDNGTMVIETQAGLAVTGGYVVGNAGATWHVVGSADFNGDGKPDLLMQNNNGAVVDYLMNGTSIAAGAYLGSAGPSWHVRGTADFNGDGHADVLLQSDSGAMVVWYTNGAAVTGASYIGNPGAGWTIEGVADFNGDGHPDILVQNTDGTLVDYTMNGATITAGALLGNPGAGWSVAGTGDYNGDGKADIVLHNDNGTAVIWTTNGSAVTNGILVGSPGAAWTGTVAGIDLNGDGNPNLILQNTDSTLVGFTMNNTAAITAGAVLAVPGAGWHAIGTQPTMFIDGTGASANLAGTPGVDQFDLTSFTLGLHQISAFDPAQDSIAFSAGLFANYAAIQAAELPYQGGTYIGLSPGSALVIQGVTPDKLSAADFVLR